MTQRSRMTALLLAVVCLLAALTGCGKKQTDAAAPIDQPTQTQTQTDPEPVDDYKPTKGDKPYYVRVNLQAGTVTVYSRDGSGYYSVPYKAMICSGGESHPARALQAHKLAAGVARSRRRRLRALLHADQGQLPVPLRAVHGEIRQEFPPVGGV